MKPLLLKNNILFLGFAALIFCSSTETEGPFFATEIKIGEVSQTEAIVWVRLTENATRVGNEAPMPDIKYKDPKTGEIKVLTGRPDATPVVTFPEGFTINNIQGATPGSEGKARLKYKLKEDQNWTEMDWQTVNPEAAFSTQFKLTNLSPGKEYELVVEASPVKSKKISASIEGKFKTAFDVGVPSEVNFIVTTGTSYPDVDRETGYKLYPNSLKLDPEFFVHTGDIVYYDAMAKTADLARWHWDRMYSFHNNIDFHRQVASYFIKDLFLNEYNVEEADNGEEGLEKAFGLIPDIIISDIMMPVMDGIEFCRRVKIDIRTSHIPVILLTARTAITFRYEGRETGADEYITKPFSAKYLLIRVRNLIKQRELLRSHIEIEALSDPGSITLTSFDEKLLKKAVEYITENISDHSINVNRLSEHVGSSRVHLYRKIKALTNMTAVEFIRSNKLKSAAHLLSQNKLTVKEVRNMTGFEDAEYLREAFKAQFGVLPSDYTS